MISLCVRQIHFNDLVFRRINICAEIGFGADRPHKQKICYELFANLLERRIELRRHGISEVLAIHIVWWAGSLTYRHEQVSAVVRNKEVKREGRIVGLVNQLILILPIANSMIIDFLVLKFSKLLVAGRIRLRKPSIKKTFGIVRPTRT